VSRGGGRHGEAALVDVGFATNNEDGTASCIAWNTHDGIPAESLRVEFVATNTGGADLFSCAGDPGWGTVTDGLCNPGDRICGPEPRRAPDNAICFSGVGDYAVIMSLKGADTSSADAISLRTAVGCAATPDIDDGGDLIRGKHQIHPQLPGTSRCVP